MTGARLGTATLLASAAVLLAGCFTGGGAIVTETPEASASGSPEASASASADASADVPEELTDEELLALLPEGATLDNISGATVTAVFFVEELGNAYGTGNTSVVEALSSEDCAYCSEQANLIAEIYSAGNSLTGGGYSIDSDRVANEERSDGFTYVEVHASAGSIELRDSDGGTSEWAPAEEVVIALRMEFADGRWLVNTVYAEPE